MAFVNLTGTAQIDDSIIATFDQSFILEVGQLDVLDPFVTKRLSVAGASVKFPRYGQLSIPSPLSETAEVTKPQIVDTGITLIPQEEGTAVTLTQLASLQSASLIDAALPVIVANNAASTSNKRAADALLASSNVLTVTGGAVSALTATDIVTPGFLNKLYNKLSRKGSGVATFGGFYVLQAHEDVIADMRADTSVGSWTSVSQYSNVQAVYANEMGIYKGFRVIKNNALGPDADAGAGAVDAYPIIALGFNGLGKATSFETQMRFTGPFDDLGRLINVGWYGVWKYGIVEPDAVWVGYVASSMGANV